MGIIDLICLPASIVLAMIGAMTSNKKSDIYPTMGAIFLVVFVVVVLINVIRVLKKED